MIYITLFFTFFEIGALTFGGGYAMLPLINEQVIAHGWMSKEELLNFVAISESTPGPFAINIATFIGVQNGGVLGAICTTLGVVLPSFIVILIVAKLFSKFSESRIVAGCMTGMRPAVIGLLTFAALTMAISVLFGGKVSTDVLIKPSFLFSFAVIAIMTVLEFKKINPLLIIVMSAVAGIIYGYACGGAIS